MLIKMDGNQPVMQYANVIGPLPATPAIAESTAAQGNVIPAQPAKGVAGYYYMSVNLPGVDTFPTALPNGVTEDDVNGQSVLGVWA
jgi:hypothetical protein